MGRSISRRSRNHARWTLTPSNIMSFQKTLTFTRRIKAVRPGKYLVVSELANTVWFKAESGSDKQHGITKQALESAIESGLILKH